MWPFENRSREGFQFDVATVSDRGLVRADNQDSVLASAEYGFFCVADGMGGGEGGALASEWICEALALAAEDPTCIDPGARSRLVMEALQRTNKRIRLYANEKHYRMMGSTVTALFTDASPTAAQVLHAGDSRLYRLRKGQLECLTRDHTMGNELSRLLPRTRKGAVLNPTSRRNPLTHVLTRAVGTELNVRPDVADLELKTGDRYLLCTDGVHDMVEDAALAAILHGRGSSETIASRLTSAVRVAGAADNFSFILVTLA